MNYGLLPEDKLLDFLDQAPADMEVVLTGKPANAGASERADYITSFDKLRHPYDKGITARIGIEF